MDLQQFVTQAIEDLGGIVEPIDYALCEAILPEQYKELFSGRTELRLAFNYEVAKENQDAEFVTFGSYLLDKLISVVHERAKVLIQYAIVDCPHVGNAQEKIGKYLHAEHADEHSPHVNIENERNLYGMYGLFIYECKLHTDEPFKKNIRIWMNMVNERSEPAMNNIFVMSAEKPQYQYPVPALNMEKILTYTNSQAQSKARQILNSLDNDKLLEKEVSRITDYYEGLALENQKRLGKKGTTPEQANVILSKGAAIQSEKMRQIREINEKYHYSFEINLSRIIIYCIPVTRYDIQVGGHGEKRLKRVFYNPVLHSFFSDSI